MGIDSSKPFCSKRIGNSHSSCCPIQCKGWEIPSLLVLYKPKQLQCLQISFPKSQYHILLRSLLCFSPPGFLVQEIMLRIRNETSHSLCTVSREGELVFSSGLSQGGASSGSASLRGRQEGKSYSEALASVGWRSQFMGFATLVLFTFCVGG